MKRGLILLMLAATVTHADVGPPLVVELAPGDGSVVPAPGTLVEFTLRLTSEVTLGVSDLAVSSSRDPQGVLAWDVTSIGAPVEFVVEPDMPLEYPVLLVAHRPEEDFTLSWRSGNRRWSQNVRVAPTPSRPTESLPSGTPARNAPTADVVPATEFDPAIDLTWMPEPAPVTNALSSPQSEPPFDPVYGELARGGAKSGLITIRGQLAYVGEDGANYWADGITIVAFDANSGSDTLLGVGLVTPDGDFEFDVIRGPESAPDIYLVFITRNGNVNVTPPVFFVDSFEESYRATTSVHPNVTGSTLDVGYQRVASSSHAPAFHIATVATRTWRYLQALNMTAFLEPIAYSWPNDVDPPYYKNSLDTVFMNREREYWEATIVHEFGHHWMKTFAVSPSPEYCNPGGFADSGGDCGHNLWCDENPNVAWTEGVPYFLANVVTDHIRDWYGPVFFSREFEEIQECGPLGDYGSPVLTEGFVSALLYDLSDKNDDEDFPGPGYDDVSYGVLNVLGAVRETPIANANVFIGTFASEFPLFVGSKFWAACANNGFQIDTQAPSTPSNVYSTTHTVGVESGNDLITVRWDPATDDLSGVRGYRVRFASYPNATGGTVVEGLEFTSTSLDVDESWYFSMVAVDEAGNMSDITSVGPFELRDPIPADFSMENPPGWPYPVVPRASGDATASAAPLPGIMIGNQPTTWMNYQIQNLGELPNTETVNNRLWVDGQLLFDSSITTTNPIDPGAALAYINLGPTTIRGGRHMVSAKTDATGAIIEPNEVNNTFNGQFVWSPLLLGTNEVIGRQGPPRPFGGFGTVLPFSSPNCDGLAYVFGNEPFVGLVVVPSSVLGLTGDVDLRAHPHTTGPLNGFSTSNILARSSRPGGATDVVVSNTASTGSLVDVGVTSFDPVPGPYTVRRITSTSLPDGVDQTFTMAAGEYATLRHTNFPGGGGTNYGTVRVSVVPANEPVSVAVVPPGTAHMGFDDATVVGTTNRSGELTLDFTYDSSLHGIVLLRDRGGDGSEPGPVEVTLWAGPTPADLRPATSRDAWDFPVVPTTGATGQPTAVPAPTTLVGGQPVTYVNASIRNDGPTPASPLEFNVLVDAAFVGGAQVAGLAGQGIYRYNAPNPISVRGGRHTLWAWADVNDLVDESDEFDNIWGKQWVWSPTVLGDGPAQVEAAPGDAVAGIDAVIEAQSGVFQLNAAGFRTTVPTPTDDDGWWQAVVVAPGDTSDVDVRLHEVAPGVEDGFAVVRSASTGGVGATEYVLTNFRTAGVRAMDVGIVAVDGAQDFRVQQIASTFAGVQPTGSTPNINLGPGEMLALLEVELPAGPRRIDLIARDGAVDWGMTLHPANITHHAKSLGGSVPTAWEAPAGAGESLTVDVEQAGRYVLAVWKAMTTDVDTDGTFRIDWSAGATSTPDVARAPRFGLREIAPNPFNPRTSVAFELEDTVPATLEVFDLRGKHVRRLHRGVLDAGVHRVTWNGLDDRGRSVASGVYFVRLEAAGRVDTRKAVLLK